MAKEEETRRILNFIDDVRRLHIPRIQNMEKSLMRTRRATYAGLGMGALGIALGAFAMYIIYERGWW